MTITVDTANIANSSNVANATSPQTFNLTTASDVDMVVVIVTIFDASSTDGVVSAVTFDGKTLTSSFVEYDATSDGHVSVWRRANADVANISSGVVSVTFGGTVTDFQASAVGVKSSVGTFAEDSVGTKATGNGSPSVSWTTTNADTIVFDAAISDQKDAKLSADGSQSEVHNVDLGADHALASYLISSSTSVTMSWTDTDNDEDWVTNGVAFNEEAGATLVNKDCQAVWDILELVNKDNQAVWDILELVNKDNQAVWDILNLVNKDTQAVWDIRELVNKDIQAVWDMSGIVGNSLQAVFDILNLINKDNQAVWDILNTVNKDTQAVWDIRELVYKDIQAVWDMSGLVNKDIQAVYDILNLVNKDNQAVWDILVLVNKDNQAVWDIRESVNKDIQAVWDILASSGTVGNSIVMNWDIKGKGGGRAQHVYIVRKRRRRRRKKRKKR